MREILKKGDIGQEVADLQADLRRAGFDVPANAIYDDTTRDAVAALQQTRGLVVDGRFGPKSRAALAGFDTSRLLRDNRPHSFFFCDPPYWKTEGYGVDFCWDQYQTLACTLHGLKGKAIVTLNDHPDIRRLFRDYVIESTDIRYTVGGGSGVERCEVVIFSWDVRSDPVALF